MKIDTSKWGQFTIGELFSISRPIARSQSKYSEGNVAFVASGNFNNGVTKWCQPLESEELDEGNCITVSPIDGSAFYQKDNFLGRGGAGSAIIILRNKNINELSGLFIASVIRHALTEYNYSDQLNSETIANKGIKLPSDALGAPDWNYMDSYMSKAIQNVEASLNMFEQADNKRRNIDVSDWKEFKVGDLFKKIVKPPVLHTREVVESVDGIPYVVRTKFDNGIKCRVNPVLGVKPSPAGVISWGAENATFFYQEEPFLSGRDIYYIDTTNLKPMSCRFLTACLQQIASKYPYNYGLFPELIKEERIKLPVTESGQPDWEYMDRYMTQITNGVRENLNTLE